MITNMKKTHLLAATALAAASLTGVAQGSNGISIKQAKSASLTQAELFAESDLAGSVDTRKVQVGKCRRHRKNYVNCNIRWYSTAGLPGRYDCHAIASVRRGYVFTYLPICRVR